MPVQRKRFRIEQAIGLEMPGPEGDAGDIGPMHREIMAELRAIRAQMGAPGKSTAATTAEVSPSRAVDEAHALLETYRAQIEQCEKLKVGPALIPAPITRTRRELAVLHGKGLTGGKMAKVT